MRRETAWLLAITALGAGLRLFHLGTQSFWVDEAVSLRFARYPLSELIGQMLSHHEVHPPLYDAALHLWSEVAQGEVWVRLPSALLGTLSIGLVYWLGRETGADGRTSVLAAGLFALSAFNVYISQEAKSYALGIFFSLAAMAVFARLLHHPTKRLALAYALTCVLCFYTHYLTALLWPCHLLAALSARPRRPFWTAYGLALCAGFLGVAPWLAVVARQAGSQDLSLFRKAVPLDLVMTPLSLLYGTAWFAPGGAWGVGLIVALLALGGGLAWVGARAMGRPWAWMLVSAVTLPLLFLYSVSTLTSLHIFWPKYVSFGLGGVFLLVARGLTALRSRRTALVLGLLFVAMNAFSLSHIYFDPMYANQDWRSLVAQFSRGADPARDRVVILPSMMVLPFRYYYSGPVPLIGVDGGDTSSLEASLRGARHVWLCMPPAHPLAQRGDVLAWFEAHGRVVGGARTESVYPNNVLLLLEFEMLPGGAGAKAAEP